MTFPPGTALRSWTSSFLKRKRDAIRQPGKTDCRPTLPVLGAVLGCLIQGRASAAASREGNTDALLEIRSMTVNGAPVSPRIGGSLQLPTQPRTVAFSFGPGTNSAQRPFRIRFKLDGSDEHWREYPAEMRICVRFLDEHNDQVGEPVFRVSGQSDGWTGAAESSAFKHRREAIIAPLRANRFWVVMTSAGPPTTLGVYAITNLVVSLDASSNSSPTIVLPWAFDLVAATRAFPGEPVGWMRDGLRPSMAKVIECLPNHTPGLVIVDDDRNGHAEWHTEKGRAVPVNPGDHLVIEWGRGL